MIKGVRDIVETISKINRSRECLNWQQICSLDSIKTVTQFVSISKQVEGVRIRQSKTRLIPRDCWSLDKIQFEDNIYSPNNNGKLSQCTSIHTSSNLKYWCNVHRFTKRDSIMIKYVDVLESHSRICLSKDDSVEARFNPYVFETLKDVISRSLLLEYGFDVLKIEFQCCDWSVEQMDRVRRVTKHHLYGEEFLTMIRDPSTLDPEEQDGDCNGATKFKGATLGTVLEFFLNGENRVEHLPFCNEQLLKWCLRCILNTGMPDPLLCLQILCKNNNNNNSNKNDDNKTFKTNQRLDCLFIVNVTIDLIKDRLIVTLDDGTIKDYHWNKWWYLNFTYQYTDIK